MAWTPTTFRARFAAFVAFSDTQVQAALDESYRAWDPAALGARYEDVVGYDAAHVLSGDPGAGVARVNKTSPETTYSLRRDQIIQQSCGGPWLPGQLPGGGGFLE